MSRLVRPPPRDPVQLHPRMSRDYSLTSPSLDGILAHYSIEYDGLRRPLEVLRALDGPAVKGNFPESDGSPFGAGPSSSARTPEDNKIIETYFHDLYGIFMKRLSYFALDAAPDSEDEVKLQALLQEMVKIKRLLKAEKAAK